MGYRARVRGEINRRLRRGRPLLSVVVATCDSAEHLDDCLGSLRRQHVREVEVLVVDLGSADATVEVAERHAREDDRVSVLQGSGWLGNGRDLGAEAARGDFLAFVDPEDAVTPHGLLFAVEALLASGSDYAVFAERPQRRGRVLDVTDRMRLEHARPALLTQPSARLAAGFVAATRCVFRRQWYDARELTFGSHRVADARHAARAALAASAVEWLDHVGSLRMVERDRSALTRAPEPSIAVTELAADVVGALALLPGGHVREVAAARSLAADFPGFLELAWSEGEDFWAALRAAVATVLQVADGAVADVVPAYQKVLLELVRSGNRHGALEFLGEVRATARQYPVAAGGTRPVVDFGPAWTAVGEEHRTLAEVELLVRADVTTVRPRGSGIVELAGWAFVDNVDLAVTRPEIRLLAVAAGGREVALDTTPTACPEADVVSGLHHADVTPSGFAARLDTRALDDGVWTLWARLGDGPDARTGRLQISAWAMAGVAAWVDGTRCLHVDHDDMGRFELHVRNPAAWLHAATAGTRELLLEVDAPVAELRRGGERIRLRAGDDGRFVVPLGALAPGGDYLLHAGGRVVPGLLRRPASIAADATTSPHVQRDRRGRVVVRHRSRAAVVESARLDGEALEAEVCLDRSVGGWRVALVDGRMVSEGSVEPIGGDHHRVRVPLATTVWGRPDTCLRSGHYALSLANDEHPDWFAPPPSADLAHTMPLEELQERMRLKVEAFAPDTPGVRVSVMPPLADDERGERHQRLLREEYAVDLADRPAVFFRAMFGEHAHGNGLGLHEELVRRGSELELLWSVADRSVDVPPGGVGLVERSRDWHEAIARSRYHMVDVHQVRWFRRPRGQVLIETFHGYPYKIMGEDWWQKMGNEPAEVGSLHRRTRDWSALVSPACYATPLLQRAFLEPAGAGDVPVLEIGYPRNDVLQRPEAAQLRAETRTLLGIAEDAVVVLYAPTFRDYLSADDLTAKRVDFFDADAALAALPDHYVVLVRGHAFNARVHDDRLAHVEAGARLIDVTDHPDPHHLMLASDVGVLDYSSLRFDYVLTGNPMVFLVPDLEQYHRFRGGVIPYEPTAPGPHVGTTTEAVAWLADLPRLVDEFAAARAEFRASYVELDDGYAAERLVAALLAPRGDA